ncbi:hypothetical protein [Terrabacter sp. NPDC000476]|uniref:hypothetical protein n=1 Tax=Terrabacter sp. NPDC000476 TaxID=3154258 RepID=UPI0033230432
MELRAGRRTGRRDRARQAGVIGLVLGGIAAGASGDYGSSTTTPNPLVPADGAFAIWAPIYAGCLGYAVHQARPSQADREIHRRVGLPLASCVALSGTWVWLQDPPLRQLPAIGATLAAGLVAHQRAAALAGDSQDRWLVAAPSGLLAGWLTLASVVATTEVAIASGVGPPPGARVAAVAVVSGVATLACTAFPDARPPRTYRGAIAWGLAGVARASWRKERATAVAAGLGAVAITARSLLLPPLGG